MAKKDKETEDIKNQLKRALADYSNLQRRVEEEKKSLVTFANFGLLVKLLGVLDILEKAAGHINDEGLNLGIKKFHEVLASEGVTEFAASGENFDPTIHEAVEVVDGADSKIVEVVEKGYALGSKTLRPAKVVVSKGKVEQD